MRRTATEILRSLEDRVARLEGRTANQIDTHLVREIELHIENTYSQYQNIQGLISMTKKHVARGNYDEDRAIKGFLNLVVVPGIQDYRREFGRNSLPRIDKATKMAIAKSLFESYEDEILG